MADEQTNRATDSVTARDRFQIEPHPPTNGIAIKRVDNYHSQVIIPSEDVVEIAQAILQIHTETKTVADITDVQDLERIKQICDNQ